MARIRSLTMLCADPAALANFYIANFGMEHADRCGSGDATLTDGGFRVELIKRRPGLRELRLEIGLHHIGIAVGDIDAVVARYGAHYPRGTVITEGDNVRIHDPECNPVALSRDNFGLRASPLRVPRIAHLALNALDPEAIRDFYRDVFGFRELFDAHKESPQAAGLSQQARRRWLQQRRHPGFLRRRGRSRGALRHRPFRDAGAGFEGDGGTRAGLGRDRQGKARASHAV